MRGVSSENAFDYFRIKGILWTAVAIGIIIHNMETDTVPRQSSIRVQIE
jgi:hypothetical protein